MNRKKRKIIIIILGIVVVCMLGTVGVRGVKKLISNPEESNQGIEIIKEQEKADVKSIESKITRLEKEESGGKVNALPLNERFADAIVLGDSMAKGLAEYEVLDAQNVVAKSGATATGDAKTLIEQGKDLKPKYVFIVLGHNDVGELHGDPNAFSEAYEVLLEYAKEAFPKAYIFAHSIFPVKEDVVEENPVYGEIDEFNKAIKDLCKEYEVIYLDYSDLPTGTDYEEDGIHFCIDFYEKWAERMAWEAAL